MWLAEIDVEREGSRSNRAGVAVPAAQGSQAASSGSCSLCERWIDDLDASTAHFAAWSRRMATLSTGLQVAEPEASSKLIRDHGQVLPRRGWSWRHWRARLAASGRWIHPSSLGVQWLTRKCAKRHAKQRSSMSACSLAARLGLALAGLCFSNRDSVAAASSVRRACRARQAKARCRPTTRRGLLKKCKLLRSRPYTTAATVARSHLHHHGMAGHGLEVLASGEVGKPSSIASLGKRDLSNAAGRKGKSLLAVYVASRSIARAPSTGSAGGTGAALPACPSTRCAPLLATCFSTASCLQRSSSSWPSLASRLAAGAGINHRCRVADASMQRR
jgi:hypothetical protein